MTSKELFSVLDDALQGECVRLGLKRRRGTSSRWEVLIGDDVLTVEAYKGPKAPFLPPIGGKFKFTCHLTGDPAPKHLSSESSIPFTNYFDDDDLQEARRIRDRVLDKIIHLNPVSPLDRFIWETRAELAKLEKARPVRGPWMLKLAYTDPDDAKLWGNFLAARLAKIVAGVKGNPVRFSDILLSNASP